MDGKCCQISANLWQQQRVSKTKRCSGVGCMPVRHNLDLAYSWWSPIQLLSKANPVPRSERLGLAWAIPGKATEYLAVQNDYPVLRNGKRFREGI